MRIGAFEFTADELRDLADAMDNPSLIPSEYANAEKYMERIGTKNTETYESKDGITITAIRRGKIASEFIEIGELEHASIEHEDRKLIHSKFMEAWGKVSK